MSGHLSGPSDIGLPRRPFRIAPAAIIINNFALEASFIFEAALDLLSRQEPPTMVDLYPADGAQVGDVGVALVVQVLDQNGNVINIAGAASLTIKLLAPDGTSADKVASLYSDGRDGKMVYVTQSGDLAQAGLYQVQGKLTLNGTPKSTRLAGLTVAVNVDNS